MSNSVYPLSFPYNVYTHCLQLENLPLTHLYPGMTLTPSPWVTPATFQTALVQHVLAYLPVLTEVLLIDVPAPLANHLAELGHQVTLIYQDIEQFQLAKMQLSPTITVQLLKITQLPVVTSKYATVIYWQEARPLDGLTLFNSVHNLLNDAGKLLVIGRFSLQRHAQPGLDEFALLDHHLAQAGRCGFVTARRVDYSETMLSFLNFWLNLLQKHHEALRITLRLTHNQLSELIYDLQREHYKYHVSEQAFIAVEWTKTPAPRWKITPVTEAQQPAICDLFQAVFGNPMSAAFWHWKYGNGRGLGITAWSKQQLIAHYGGSVREILYFGQPQVAVQITDVMVLGKERGILTRKGAFFLTTASFLEYYIGYGVQTWIGFGFPSRRHVQLAQNLHLYAPVGEVVELRYPSLVYQATTSSPVQLLPWQAKLSLRRVIQLWRLKAWNQPKLVDKLWQEMQICLQDSLVGVRNWQRLQYRYLSHPQRQYELFLVTQAARVVALVVVHFEGELCKLMDFIGHLDHIPLAIQQVRYLAQQRGMSQISVWITEQFVSLFPARDRTRLTLEIAVPHNIWTPTFPPSGVAERWWLMAGDTDYL